MADEAVVPRHVAFRVNGRAVEMELEPHAMLLDVLRGPLGLTGTKRSCDVQVCGACTVLLDGLPVSACCTLAYEARGRDVLTIEGVGSPDALHPVQAAFVEHAAVQCGFCTAGMVLTALVLLRETPTPTTEQVQEFMKGTLCRCTGYRKIIEAIVDAGRRAGTGGAAS